MKKSLIVLVCISLSALALYGCAAKETGGTAEAGPQSHKVSVATGEFHEYCDIWNVGDTVKVSFTSTKPVVFNVHYHTQTDKLYPIKDVATDNFSESFVVQTKDVHCGMWQNNNDSFVKVTYELEVMGK